MTPGAQYALSFWASGKSAVGGCGFGHDGIFGLDLTGNATLFLAAPSGCSSLGNSHVYEFTFVPSDPVVTLTFTNWGHFSPTGTTGWTLPTTTELVLDDVIINAVPEPNSVGLLALSLLGLALAGRISPSCCRAAITARNPSERFGGLYRGV